MTIGFIGLGKMGQQMVSRLLDHQHQVVVTDLNPASVQLCVQLGATAATDRADLVRQLGDAPVVWLMIPAPFVQAELDALLQALPAGSTVIDGGNSNYADTVTRAAQAAARGVTLLDVGTSGGILGLQNGFSMMVGGEPAAVTAIQPFVEALAQPGGWAHVGPAGSGHYVKMIHNGIEYGMMEAYAEGYRLLKDGRDFTGLDLAAIADLWEHGSIIASNLNAQVVKVLQTNPDLAGIDGVVAQSGEAQWTMDAVRANGFEAPVIQASLDVRTASAAGTVHFGTKLLAAMRNAFGGHDLNKS